MRKRPEEASSFAFRLILVILQPATECQPLGDLSRACVFPSVASTAAVLSQAAFAPAELLRLPWLNV